MTRGFGQVPGWLIAAPRSGSGKTTVTLGIVAALRRRGVAVRTAKSGPDYIDPAFHAAASGAPGTNLDSWAMPPPLLDALYAVACCDADLLVVESAMGLFDGVAGPRGRTGSSSDLAARFGLNVLLVLDVSGQAQTAAAVAHGLASFDPANGLGALNRTRYSNPQFDALLAQASAEFDEAKRNALLADATTVAMHDYAILPLYWQKAIWAARPGVRFEANESEDSAVQFAHPAGGA